ncbi:DUF4148 domain-containing protein [Paraburkholderia bannensis]|uniref:DUF4148 domain-containing protein n=1 Tax=Paraburkholderia bannensis TaxID=765414 RepID=UPI0004884116|nr:DUF4148 domain-containing protein [Paraburkholderia bannensis]
MKISLVAVSLAVVFSAPTLSFAQSSQPLTRAQVRAEMVQLEHAGYNPARMNPRTYPADIQSAEMRVAQENAAYGASTEGSSQVGVK